MARERHAEKKAKVGREKEKKARRERREKTSSRSGESLGEIVNSARVKGKGKARERRNDSLKENKPDIAMEDA